jgi:alpha-galactosidase
MPPVSSSRRSRRSARIAATAAELVATVQAICRPNCRLVSKAVGLCDSVQHTAQHLANCLGEDLNEISYVSAGIKNVAFFLKYFKRDETRNVVDLYPRLKELAANGKVPEKDRVRFDMLKRFGYFVTESSVHFLEYVPWYIKPNHCDLLERLDIPLDDYAIRCERRIAGWHELRRELEGGAPIAVHRSNEYASGIPHSVVTGEPRIVYGNVRNNGLIKNSPKECVVEVPCNVDRDGIQPIVIGGIPPELAAVIRKSVQPSPDLAVAFAMERAAREGGADRLEEGCIRHRADRTRAPWRFAAGRRDGAAHRLLRR